MCAATEISLAASSRAGSPAPAPATRPEGRPFGRYRLLEEVGRGGMGVVWKAQDTELRRRVALKQILGAQAALDPGLVERFQREARSAARLRHPGIVPVHDVGVQEGVHYFTSEFVEGRPLSALTGKPMAPAQAVSIVRAIADALQYAHEEGIVHRDVKPGNILLDERGAPRLLDFGLAKDTSGDVRMNLTTSGSVFGTPRYMSPEQVDGRTGEVGPASDQFSLAAILYELLTGRVPFEAENLRIILTKIAAEEPVPPRRYNPRVPRELEEACLTALAKNPQDRFRSMREFSLAIDRGLRGLYRSGRSRRQRAEKEPSRRWIALAAAGAAVLVLAVAAPLALFSRPSSDGEETPDGSRAPGALLETGEPTESSRVLDPVRTELDHALAALEDASVPWEGIPKRIAAAKERIEELLARAPDHAGAHLLMGLSRELLGEFPEAEASYRRAVELDAALGPAKVRLARLLLVRALLLLIENGSPAPERMKEALGLAREARAELARADDLGASGPADGELAAVILAHLSAGPDALLRARAAIEKHAGTGAAADFHWIAGVTAFDEPAVSRAHLDEAIRIRPRHRLAIFYRSMLRQGQLEPAGALADLDLAVLLGLHLPAVHTNRAVLRWQHAGDTTGARQDMDEAVRRSPRSFVARKIRAAVRFQTGDIDGALADLDAALEISPEHADALRDRGYVRLQKRDYAGARRDLDLAIRLEPGNVDALINRGYARHLGGDVHGALSDYEEAVRLDPSRPDAYLCRGDLRDDLGDTPGALADVEKALSLAPAGWVHREQAQALLETLRSRPR